jgi:hypothetical protein
VAGYLFTCFPALPAPEDRRIMALIVENHDREFVRGYMHERGVEPDQPYMGAPGAMCEKLHNYHAMMRFELTARF